MSLKIDDPNENYNFITMKFLESHKKIRDYIKSKESLSQKEIKVYSNNVTKIGVQTNTDFWKFIKSLLTNKGFLENMEIKLAEKDKLVT